MLDKIVDLYTDHPGAVLIALLAIIVIGGTAGGYHLATLRETIEDQRLAYEQQLTIEKSRSKLEIERANEAHKACSDSMGMLGAKVRTYDDSRTRMEDALAAMESAIVPSCKAPSVLSAIERMHQEISAVAANAEAVERLTRVTELTASSEKEPRIEIHRPTGYSTLLLTASCVLLGIFIAVLYGKVRRRAGKPG